MTTGSKQTPWVLTTAPGSSQYVMYADEQADPPVLVCQVEEEDPGAGHRRGVGSLR